jgi:hypothetical protein
LLKEAQRRRRHCETYTIQTGYRHKGGRGGVSCLVAPVSEIVAKSPFSVPCSLRALRAAAMRDATRRAALCGANVVDRVVRSLEPTPSQSNGRHHAEPQRRVAQHSPPLIPMKQHELKNRDFPRVVSAPYRGCKYHPGMFCAGGTTFVSPQRCLAYRSGRDRSPAAAVR